MHRQNGQSGSKAHVAITRHPVSNCRATSPFMVVQHAAKVPALKGDRCHKRRNTSCSTHIAHYIQHAAAAAAAVTTLSIFGLREEAVGRINHVAIAARALRLPSGTLDEQNTSSTDESIRQAQSNGSIRASRRESSGQGCRRQNHQRCLRARYRNSSRLIGIRVLTGPSLARRQDCPSSSVYNYRKKSLYKVSAYVLFQKTAQVSYDLCPPDRPPIDCLVAHLREREQQSCRPCCFSSGGRFQETARAAFRGARSAYC